MSKNSKSDNTDINLQNNESKNEADITKRKNALLTLKNNKFNDIPARIEFIKLLLGGNKLNPMVDFDTCDTEHVENRTNGFDIRDIMTKKHMDFNKLICEIGGKLLYIKSGTTGHTFKGIIYDNDSITELLNYAVKVVAYPVRENYGDVNDVKRPENAELMMLRVLSYFVVNCQTPHIVLPIGTFNTSIKPFIALAKNKIIDNKKYDQFIKRHKQSEFHDEVSILISEWANCGDLLDYIRNNYKTMVLKDWRTIFFQIISVLAVIQNKYPSFRHNDLKANNILVQKIDSRKKNNYFLYKLNLDGVKYEYYVPNIGIQIKLWDFDFACIPGVVENSKVSSEWTNKINVGPLQNRYYDLHYFFNTFTKKGFFPEFWTAKEIPQSVRHFVKRIVPDKYSKSDTDNGDKCLVTDRGRILTNKEYTTPTILLIKDKFFNKMRDPANKVNQTDDNDSNDANSQSDHLDV
jgi:serine/threonine protein kinase